MEKNQHGGVVNLNEIHGITVAEIVELQVTGKVEAGTIEKIEALETEGIVFKEGDERNSSESKIYEVTKNGTYHFRITGSTGRSYITEVKVNNAAPIEKDLITGIANINEAGYKMIKVNGRTSEVNPTIPEVDDPQIYTLDVIYCDGDLILKNGSYTLNASKSQVAKTVDGLTLSGSTWSVGKASDVNTNTVVLKVNGNLTLESSYILTSVKANTTDVAKGLFIYCTGVLTINGKVDMSTITCTATAQNVYLWQNNDGSFEYIRKNGGAGGSAGDKGGAAGNGQGFGYTYTITGSNGTSSRIEDSHWISGGGAGGIGWNSYAVYGQSNTGEAGNCWRGGKGGIANEDNHGWTNVTNGGGVIFAYGTTLQGNGTILANGADGDGYYTGGGWWHGSGSGGSGGGIILLAESEAQKPSLQCSVKAGSGYKNENVLAGNGGIGTFAIGTIITGDWINL